MHQSVQETVEHGYTFLARTPSACVELLRRCVTGAWLRQTIEMNRDSCVDKRDGQRAARGWQHCWRENELEKIVEFGCLFRIDDCAMYSPRLMKEVLKTSGSSWLTMDGWTVSVCPQLDQRQTFLSWTHKNGRKTITIIKDICSAQLRLRKERENRSIGC